MAQVITDLLDIILTMGAIFYAYKMAESIKGEVLERGMRLILLSLVFLLLSMIADLADDLGFGSGIFDIVHDLILAVFIMLMLFGLRRMVRDISDFLKYRIEIIRRQGVWSVQRVNQTAQT